MIHDPVQSETLFDVPPGASVPPKRKTPRPMAADTAKYTRRSKTSREWCGDCQHDIDRRGFAVAPRVAVAIWRRVSDSGAVLLLCDRHMKVRREEEAS